MKILCVLGASPEAVKMSRIGRQLRATVGDGHVAERIVEALLNRNVNRSQSD